MKFSAVSLSRTENDKKKKQAQTLSTACAPSIASRSVAPYEAQIYTHEIYAGLHTWRVETRMACATGETLTSLCGNTIITRPQQEHAHPTPPLPLAVRCMCARIHIHALRACTGLNVLSETQKPTPKQQQQQQIKPQRGTVTRTKLCAQEEDDVCGKETRTAKRPVSLPSPFRLFACCRRLR